MNNVIQMPRAVNGIYEILIIMPKLFEEIPPVIQALRENKSVLLNLTMMERAQAQRAIDFVTGGAYSIEGYQERIGESVFLFTPSSVKVS